MCKGWSQTTATHTIPTVTADRSPAEPRRPGRPRKYPFADREERVLDAALAEFAERGRSAVSVDVIAARAGINKALVYEHFRSKDDLFAAAVRRERDRMVAFITARGGRGGAGPTRERIRAQYHSFLDFSAANPQGVRLLALPEAADVLDGQGRDALSSSLAAQLRRELRDAGLPSTELPNILAAMLVGMAGGVLRGAAEAPWDPVALVDLLTSFTMAGLTGTEREILERADRPIPRPRRARAARRATSGD
jgi:AcrR family transcriptional regulator